MLSKFNKQHLAGLYRLRLESRQCSDEAKPVPGLTSGTLRFLAGRDWDPGSAVAGVAGLPAAERARRGAKSFTGVLRPHHPAIEEHEALSPIVTRYELPVAQSLLTAIAPQLRSRAAGALTVCKTKLSACTLHSRVHPLVAGGMGVPSGIQGSMSGSSSSSTSCGA